MDEKKIREMEKSASRMSFTASGEGRAMCFVGLAILELAETIKIAQEVKGLSVKEVNKS